MAVVKGSRREDELRTELVRILRKAEAFAQELGDEDVLLWVREALARSEQA